MAALLGPLVHPVPEEVQLGGEHGDAGGVLSGKAGRSYVKALVRSVVSSAFKMPTRYPVEVDDDLGFIFTEVEMNKVAEGFPFALVLKFICTRPLIDAVRLAIVKTWGLLEIPTVSFMEDYHVLVQMASEREFVHGWAREGQIIEGCGFRIFRWTKDFDLQEEPSMAAQWIFLPGLPMHLYRWDCLQILASRFGRYLGTDDG
ncbi:hypothetical protein I3843_Q001900 [Carya illinoinensis]|nr:hypothetical protein I3843_Q001900 [Carya illinoinensis]